MMRNVLSAIRNICDNLLVSNNVFHHECTTDVGVLFNISDLVCKMIKLYLLLCGCFAFGVYSGFHYSRLESSQGVDPPISRATSVKALHR